MVIIAYQPRLPEWLTLLRFRVAWLLLLSAIQAGAGVFLEGKPVLERDYAVSMPILRWGTLGDGQNDQLVGQIASDRHREVTLVFNLYAPTERNPVYRMTLVSRTHLLGASTQDRYCAVCHPGPPPGRGAQRGFRDGSTPTPGHCYFSVSFPRIAGVNRMRLVDVRVQDQSVRYLNRFGVSDAVFRSPMRVPALRNATLHQPDVNLESLAPDHGDNES